MFLNMTDSKQKNIYDQLEMHPQGAELRQGQRPALLLSLTPRLKPSHARNEPNEKVHVMFPGIEKDGWSCRSS